MFAPNAIVTARGMERFHFRPWGRMGGGAGTLCETLLNPGTPQQKSIGKVTNALHPAPGDVVAINTPGGGGFGDPFERDPAKVLKDVSEELISIDIARLDYGVVITAALKVDDKATAALRSERPSGKKAAEFTYGPERDAYEAAFPPEVQDALVKALLAVPASQRQFYKSRVWAKVTDNGRARVAQARPSEIPAILEQCRKEVTQILI